ncbi:MAG: glycosyl hydrolase 115 family protein [Bacteroidaceae bacterium]|nr:glycosyl hydrolase 115 family protein [Bacteroidaceae bacterium]
MKRFFVFSLWICLCAVHALAVDLMHCQIVVSEGQSALAGKMARVLSEDVERVTGVRPVVTTADDGRDHRVVLRVGGLTGWERFQLRTEGTRLTITGSDARGLAYGVLHVSECIGVNPWYWWADVPVVRRQKLDYKENVTSEEPSVKYRGFFINDEDWGLKTWAAGNFEKDLQDIGPRTYDKVCELILRLKGNMLAPAMHSCTGAFYSHPESQRVAAEWGIMITTSHCEPMLLNNAAKSEWDKARDGEWNYLTNKERIWQKFDDRLKETAQYDNIYTVGMRGLHDEAMKGSTDPQVRARTLEQVFADQREILQRRKGRPTQEIPQIFVPYKATLDIYDAGLHVPEDVTLVWPDDNYGYMKRVSSGVELGRSGGSGVYYHLSYLGAPHDNLWIQTTAPVLMYEELLKAYEAGADRYWLLNVGDIKPMELGVQLFFDMAWDISAFDFGRVNKHQAAWLAGIFGKQYKADFQQILDTYYRLAWQRKPEFMGYEMEWDSKENNRLHDTDFSFSDGTAECRLSDYQRIADRCETIGRKLPEAQRPAFFELLEYAVKSAYQMNRKFLMAQRNHETGSKEAAEACRQANDSVLTLLKEYNGLLDGKWQGMISQVPPGYTAKYHLMPELVDEPTAAYRLPENQRRPDFEQRLDLKSVKAKGAFRLVEGIGTDWTCLQLGKPHDAVQNPQSLSSEHIDLAFECGDADSVTMCISCVPFWPVSLDRSNRLGVSVDGSEPVVLENKIEEWSWPWKLQVLENRKDFVVTLPLSGKGRKHRLSLIIGDPGQMVQRITIRR